MGGGARAAYAVGLLRCLARRFPEGCGFTAMAGVSAGAINAVYLASRHGSFARRTDGLAELWRSLEPDSVMDVATSDLFRNIVIWGLRLMGGGADFLPTARGLVDCRPLRRLLEEVLAEEEEGIPGIGRRLGEDGLRSLLLATTSYATGEAVVWSQGTPVPEGWARPGRRARETSFGVDHVMASAALPILFPAVRLEGEWHGDGDVRLASPLSPLVALGVDRILAVSTHHGSRPSESRALRTGYPSPGQVAGTVLNTAVLHHLESDARKLHRVNRLLELECGAGEDGRQVGPFRQIGLFVLRPSRDLEALAGRYESGLPWPLRHMIRGLGTHATSSPGLLSMISFQPDYLQALMDAGEEDAEEHADDLVAFLRAGA